MALARTLLIFCILLLPASSWAAVLWQNGAGNVGVMRLRDGSIVTTSDIKINFPSPIPDGAGGITSSGTDLLPVPGGSALVDVVESSSAAEVAAAGVFLPEELLFAIAGQTLAQLIWDAATHRYGTPQPVETATCSNGSLVSFAGFTSVSQWYAANNGHSFVSGSPLASVTWYSDHVVIEVINQGSPDYFSLGFTNCTDPTPGAPTIVDVPQSQLVPYIQQWLDANPNSAQQLAQQELANNTPPQAQMTSSGPSSVAGSPSTSTTTNPDGSTVVTTTTPTTSLSYSGPNVEGSTTTTTITKTCTGAGSCSTVTNVESAPLPQGSAPSPSYQLVPPTAAVPSPQPTPPGVIQLPLPTIDNSGGQCPAPIVLNIGLPGVETVTWDLTPWCDLADLLHPLVVTAGALAAAFILVR